MKIAITGTIGAGKSKVCDIIRSKGYTVYDTDAMVHTYYEKGGNLYDQVVTLLGCDILAKDQTIDRKKMAQIVFDNPQLLSQLEQLVFPQVQADIETYAKAAKQAVFFEVPLLFEAGMDAHFDFIMMITADTALRINRLIKRGLSQEDVEKRMKRHVNEAKKIASSDCVIYNNGTLVSLITQVETVLKSLETSLERNDYESNHL